MDWTVENILRVVGMALVEFALAKRKYMAPTIPATPLLRAPKGFCEWGKIKFDADFSIGFGVIRVVVVRGYDSNSSTFFDNDPKEKSANKIADISRILCESAGWKPVKIRSLLTAIDRATRWYERARAARERMAQEILRQQQGAIADVTARDVVSRL